MDGLATTNFALFKVAIDGKDSSKLCSLYKTTTANKAHSRTVWDVVKGLQWPEYDDGSTSADRHSVDSIA